MKFHIITLFPEMFHSYLDESILARAQKKKLLSFKFYNPRDFVTGKYKKVWPDGNISSRVDEKPYGGGPGMVLRAEPILKAVSSALRGGRWKVEEGRTEIILLSPSGKQFTNADAERLSKKKHLIFISGRYEGIDARVKKILKAKEYSVGPYILTGGELPALTMIDAISRRIPGVLGKLNSLEENRVSTSEVYTRPEVLEWKAKKYKVPKMLLSGKHAEIEKWKQKYTREANSSSMEPRGD